MRRNQVKALKPNPTTVHSYPAGHIVLLPDEILIEIFSCFEKDFRQLLLLALVCRAFNQIISTNLLYKNVSLSGTEESFFNFYDSHMPPLTLTKKFNIASFRGSNSGVSAKLCQIHKLTIENPPKKSDSNNKAKIAGTYNIEAMDKRSQESIYDLFNRSVANLLKECKLLETLEFTEILPYFAFPLNPQTNSNGGSSTSFLFLGFKREKPKMSLKKLVLSAQSGWSITFKLELLSLLFLHCNKIEELELRNYIIDETKISNSLTQAPADFSIDKLTLVSCSYINKPRKYPREALPIFNSTSSLSLMKINSGSDLSLIDFIKANNNLTNLTIDLSSSIFFDSSSIDRQFTFSKFNSFFKLLCSGSGSYGKINQLNLANFNLLDKFANSYYYKKEEEHDVDDWVAPSNDTFKAFLAFIAPMKNINIYLKDRGYDDDSLNSHSIVSSRRNSEIERSQSWMKIFKPLTEANPNCKLRVFDDRFHELFTTTR